MTSEKQKQKQKQKYQSVCPQKWISRMKLPYIINQRDLTTMESVAPVKAPKGPTLYYVSSLIRESLQVVILCFRKVLNL